MRTSIASRSDTFESDVVRGTDFSSGLRPPLSRPARKMLVTSAQPTALDGDSWYCSEPVVAVVGTTEAMDWRGGVSEGELWGVVAVGQRGAKFDLSEKLGECQMELRSNECGDGEGLGGGWRDAESRDACGLA